MAYLGGVAGLDIYQLCLHMAFPIEGHEGRALLPLYLSGESRLMLENFPELGFFRDVVFLFKMLMVPSSEALPEIRAWTPLDAALTWRHRADEGFIVSGFGRALNAAGIAAVHMNSTHTKEESSEILRSLNARPLATKVLLVTPERLTQSVALQNEQREQDSHLRAAAAAAGPQHAPVPEQKEDMGNVQSKPEGRALV